MRHRAQPPKNTLTSATATPRISAPTRCTFPLAPVSNEPAFNVNPQESEYKDNQSLTLKFNLRTLRERSLAVEQVKQAPCDGGAQSWPARWLEAARGSGLSLPFLQASQQMFLCLQRLDPERVPPPWAVSLFFRKRQRLHQALPSLLPCPRTGEMCVRWT